MHVGTRRSIYPGRHRVRALTIGRVWHIQKTILIKSLSHESFWFSRRKKNKNIVSDLQGADFDKLSHFERKRKHVHRRMYGRKYVIVPGV